MATGEEQRTDDGIEIVVDDETDAVGGGDELERLRRENAELRAAIEASQASPTDRQRPRSILAVVLVVIGSLLLPVAAGTTWIRSHLLSTDDYVRTVGPLASDPAVQAAVSDRIADVVVEGAEIQALAAEALPEDAQVLAPFIASGARTVIATAANEFVASDFFRASWEEANRIGHAVVLELVSGRDEGIVRNDQGQVFVPIGEFVGAVADQLTDETGIDFNSLLSDEDLEETIVLAESDELANAQELVRLVDDLGWLSLVITAALLVAAFFLAPNRSRGALWVGVGVTASMVVALLGYQWARDVYESDLATEVQNPQAAMAFFDIGTRFMLRSLRALFVVGLMLTAIGWLTGPGQRALRFRAAIDRSLGRASRSFEASGPFALARFAQRNKQALQYATAIIAAVVLVLWDKPTGFVVLSVAIVAALALAAISVLARVGDDADQLEEPAPGPS